jgi:hypothetical protein
MYSSTADLNLVSGSDSRARLGRRDHSTELDLPSTTTTIGIASFT